MVLNGAEGSQVCADDGMRLELLSEFKYLECV